jgi:hypothetical protein
LFCDSLGFVLNFLLRSMVKKRMPRREATEEWIALSRPRHVLWRDRTELRLGIYA